MEFPIWYKDAETLYKQEKSFAEIGKELNVNRKQVSRWLQLGGHRPNHKYLKGERVSSRKYTLDENIFSVIDTEEKAYWLGFLYADGYVSKLKSETELALQQKDENHLKKFAIFMKTNKPFYRTKRTLNEKTYFGVRVVINSKKVKEDLQRLGCTTEKTLTLKFPTEKQVPNHLIRHFIRGYFDGDGSTTLNNGRINFEIIGTVDFLNGMIDYFGLHHNKKHAAGKSFRIMYSGKYSSLIMKELYRDATIYLDRKRKKYQTLCNIAV